MASSSLPRSTDAFGIIRLAMTADQISTARGCVCTTSPQRNVGPTLTLHIANVRHVHGSVPFFDIFWVSCALFILKSFAMRKHQGLRCFVMKQSSWGCRHCQSEAVLEWVLIPQLWVNRQTVRHCLTVVSGPFFSGPQRVREAEVPRATQRDGAKEAQGES